MDRYSIYQLRTNWKFFHGMRRGFDIVKYKSGRQILLSIENTSQRLGNWVKTIILRIKHEVFKTYTKFSRTYDIHSGNCPYIKRL